MKILVFINSLQVGGAESYVAENIPFNLKHGFHVDVLLIDGKDSNYKKELQNAGVNIFQLGTSSMLYNPFFIFKIIPYLKNYDLIHGHLFPTLYWLAFAKLISFAKVPIVFTEHSTENRRRNNFVLKAIDKFVYSLYDNVVTISEASYANLSTYLGQNSHLKIIRNGVDAERLIQQAEQNPIELNRFSKENKILLQIAGFRIEKDQDTLIRALVYLPNDFVAVFLGNGQRIEECKSLAKKLNLEGRVYFLGNQSNIGSYIKKAFAVVMSSHWEGFGKAAVEGMVFGKPVVASDVSGLKDVVGGAGLLFDPGNEKELSEIILKLFYDDEFYNHISKSCFYRSKEYCISKMINEYENLYKGILSNNTFEIKS